MKKAGLIIASAVIVIIICLVPFNRRKAVYVNASYFNCYRQLITVQNWKNWLPELNKVYNRDSLRYKLSQSPQGIKVSIPGTYFLIKQEGSTILHIKKVSGTREDNYSYTIIPSSSVLSTAVIVTFKTNIFKSIIPAQDGLEKTSVNDFKKFMESVKLYYGFSIEKDFMNARKIIVKRKTISAGQIYSEAAEMQKQLVSYIGLKHLTKAGSVMVQYNPKNGDSLQMLVGIPVDRQIVADNGFLYMYIPATRALTADFKGKYPDKRKIYNAMGSYLEDKYLHAKIAPYEEFVSGFPTGNNDVVAFRLTYPIF